MRGGRPLDALEPQAAVHREARRRDNRVADERRERVLAPQRCGRRIGEVPDARRQSVDELADPSREHRLHRRAPALEVDAGEDRVRAGGSVHARAKRPGAVRADARIEQRRHRAVVQALHDHGLWRQKVARALTHCVGSERANAGIAVGQAVLPRCLAMNPDVLLPGVGLVEDKAVRHGIARPLRPAD
jgi:hypothetical protein